MYIQYSAIKYRTMQYTLQYHNTTDCSILPSLEQRETHRQTVMISVYSTYYIVYTIPVIYTLLQYMSDVEKSQSEV